MRKRILTSLFILSSLLSVYTERGNGIDVTLFGKNTTSGYIKTLSATEGECPPNSWSVYNTQASLYCKMSYKVSGDEYEKRYTEISFNIDSLDTPVASANLNIYTMLKGNPDSPDYIMNVDVEFDYDCFTDPLVIGDTLCYEGSADTAINYSAWNSPTAWTTIPLRADLFNNASGEDTTLNIMLWPAHWHDTEQCVDVDGNNYFLWAWTSRGDALRPYLEITYEEAAEPDETEEAEDKSFLDSELQRQPGSITPIKTEELD